MKIQVIKVKAFTTSGRGGNPAGVVLGADGLSSEQMLAVAARVGYSETAFVQQSSSGTKKIRFYTPTDEVDLCGHATIATWTHMFRSGIVPAGMHLQETKAGLLKIEVRGDGFVYMEQTPVKLYEEVDASELVRALGVDVSDFAKGLAPQIISTGLRDLIVPLAHKTILEAMRPDTNAVTEMSRKYDLIGFHVFALHKEGPSVASARNFAPLVGIDEESATGTSNGALLCYLRSRNALPHLAEYRIEQGETMGELSYIYGKFDQEIVWIGGETVLVDDVEMLI